MEQAPRARVRKRDEAGENAILKSEAQHPRVKTVWEPTGVKAGDQAEAAAGGRAKKAEAQDRAKAGDLNTLTIHSDCVTIGFFMQLG
jgi:hypothetical protein